MLIFINQTYSPTLTEQEIDDCTRQFWYKVAEATRTPDGEGSLRYPVALAVVDSVVVRVYSIAAWFSAGTTLSSLPSDPTALADLWEFVGNVLVQHKLLGKKLMKEGNYFPAKQRGMNFNPR